MAAKTALTAAPGNILLPHYDFRQHIHQYFKSKWQTIWDSQIGNKLHEIKPNIRITYLHLLSQDSDDLFGETSRPPQKKDSTVSNQLQQNNVTSGNHTEVSVVMKLYRQQPATTEQLNEWQRFNRRKSCTSRLLCVDILLVFTN